MGAGHAEKVESLLHRHAEAAGMFRHQRTDQSRFFHRIPG